MTEPRLIVGDFDPAIDQLIAEGLLRYPSDLEMIERDPPAPREDEACWCPDAMRDLHIAVTYCPRHGSNPDHTLK